MDIEFHYYITYLTAAICGFSKYDAQQIAHSAQFIDDNFKSYKIYDESHKVYKTIPSQSIDYFRNNHISWDLLHFIPGDYKRADKRKDSLLHPYCVTPNSYNANSLMQYALNTNNVLTIGIASHAYVDTWAHQNFIGRKNIFNSIEDLPLPVIRSVGHANALSKPDQINLIWRDIRLMEERVRNKKRALNAAKNLYQHYVARRKAPLVTKDVFIELLDWAIGKETIQYVPLLHVGDKERMKRYNIIAKRYTGENIPRYDKGLWLKQAVHFNNNRYYWKCDYPNSLFYQFNQALEETLKFMSKVLHY